MKIYKIVITGGPCGGKSTALTRITEHFTTAGFTVLTVPETATELIGGGVAPWTCGTNLDYQLCQMKLQLVKEELFETAAKTMNSESLLLVCDRGLMDNKAYMSDADFNTALSHFGLTEQEIISQYNGVFHLVTAADGAEEFYTTANNSARTETPEMARQLDRKIAECWQEHPNFRMIDNSTNFQNKISRLINEIGLLLKNK